MKIVLPGGAGHIGSVLLRAFAAQGHDVVVLSRSARANSGRAGAGRAGAGRVVRWDGENPGDWVGEIDGADVVVNLAGRSVNCRYHAANRREIIDSRVKSTQAVGQAIAQAAQPPRTWLQASTATIYAHRYDAPNDEMTGILGGDEPDSPSTWRFSIEVAKAWEQAALETKTPHTRKVLMRAAIVMSPDPGGPFEVLLGLVRRGLGGAVGDGRQYMSWIHDADLGRAVRWLIDHDELSGPVNLAAPHPLPNAEFMRTLRTACGMRIGLPATRWMLEFGTFLMRTESELVLKSRRVIPGRLLDSGFRFQFPTWPEAAADLYQRWHDAKRRAS